MSRTPLELYTQRLKEGALQKDPFQKEAIESLQRLYDELTAKKKFLGRKKLPKGIYMHGGVGRGKSMLMDMFFSCLPDDIRKKRIHFHAFMIDVHDYIHSRRESDDFSEGVDGALPSLAARIAERSSIQGLRGA